MQRSHLWVLPEDEVAVALLTIFLLLGNLGVATRGRTWCIMCRWCKEVTSGFSPEDEAAVTLCTMFLLLRRLGISAGVHNVQVVQEHGA